MSALPNFPFPPEPQPESVPPRRRIFRAVALTLLAIVVVVVIAAALYLRSNSFHQYVLRTAQQKVSDSIGSQVQLQNFALHLSTLSLDMYGITVHGAQPYPDPPLLRVEHITAGVRIVSVLHRSWYLDDIRIDHPVVNVIVDKNGIDNIPKPKSTGGSRTSVFDLAVRHVMLNRGQIYYNNRKSILDADLHDLSFQSAFDTAQKKYSGTLAYSAGHLQTGTFNPLDHDLQAPFDATPTAFHLNHAVLNSGQSRIVLSATVEDYSNPRVNAEYDAVIDAGHLRYVMKNQTVPSGMIRFSGGLAFESQQNRPVLDAVRLNGTLSSRALRVQMPSFHGDISNIAARYSLENGNADIRDIRAHLLGGELTGAMTMRDIAGASQSQLRAALRGVSVADIKSLMPSTSLKTVALSGTANAQTTASWGKTLDNLVAHTDADIHASAAPTANKNTNVPLDGVIHADYVAARKEIGLTNSYLRTPQTSLALNGLVSNRSSLQVQLRSNDLHELETVSNMFRPATPGQPAQALGLYGSATFNGAVRGTTSAPEITGQLATTNLHVRGTDFRTLRTSLDASPSSIKLQNGELQPATGGHVAFNLSAALSNWSFTNTSPVNIAVNASQLNVADLAKAAGSQAPVSGILSADVAVQGSQLNPIGHGTISLTQAKVSDEPVQSLTLNFQGTGNQVNGKLALRMAAGSANGTFAYLPKQQGYDAQLSATGIRLDQLQAVKSRNMKLTGILNFNANGRGTINDPQLTAKLEIPKLQIQDQTIDRIALNANVANKLANFTLDSQAVNTSLRAKGSVQLTGDYYADATLDTQSIPLQPLVAMYAPSQAANLSGQTELHGTLKGPLKNKSALDAHLTIPTLQMKYKDVAQIAAASPIHIDYANGIIQLQRTNIRGTDTDLQIQGTVPVNSTAPVSLLALGTVDLQLAQLFSPDIASSGQVRFNINSYGARTDPNVQGQIEIVNANLATGDIPVGLQNGNGVLTLTKDRLEISKFNGTVGGGTITASGAAIYRPSLQFDLAVSGKGINLMYPAGVREGVDTTLTLSGSTEAATLRGRVRVNQLSFTPDFDLNEFVGQFGSDTTPPPSQGFTQNLQLDLALQSVSGVSLSSRTLSLQAAANLQVRGTAAQPVVLGRVNLNSGDLIFMGNRYVLQGGTVDFVNPARTEPVLNVGANTTIQQYNISMRFQGPVDHLHTNYSSDPALPPSDIINLLAFGQTTEAAAANPTAPGTLGAQSLIASGVSSQVTNRLEKVAGISHLSIDPVLAGTGGQTNPGARITVQQKVTSSLFVTFSTDVTATQTQVIQLQYKVSPRLSVSSTRDQNGGFGFDTRIRKTW
ncbi:MAG: hypothetical protein JWO13_3503 [Acidobacteriales bacterium]|nr:hypothetical protein [Terriglobales bacterium]